METVDVAIVGAGPYGLAAAAYLSAAGIDTRVFGTPMRFWQAQTPAGMLLRSPYRGSDIGDPGRRLTFPRHQRASGLPVANTMNGSRSVPRTRPSIEPTYPATNAAAKARTSSQASRAAPRGSHRRSRRAPG